MNFTEGLPTHIRNIPAYKSENPAEELERDLGEKVIQLGMNENPLGPSRKAVAAIHGYLENIAPYPDDSGYTLRHRLAEHYKLSMDEIIISSGASDLLSMAYHIVLNPGVEAMTGEVSFVVYYQLAEMLGMPLTRVPMRDYKFHLDAMTDRITPRTRLILIANPNNPTGTIVGRQELDAFIQKIPESVLVVLDEAYFEYVRKDSDYPHSLDYVPSGKPVLILRTFSKAFGLAGLRIGYGIAPREIIEALYTVRMAFNTSSVAQVAALAAWDDHDHVERSVRLNQTELEFLYRELSRRKVKYVPSSANFILLDLDRPGRDVTAKLLKLGVIVRPAWGLPTGMRVSVGTHEQNEKFLAALDKVL